MPQSFRTRKRQLYASKQALQDLWTYGHTLRLQRNPGLPVFRT